MSIPGMLATVLFNALAWALLDWYTGINHASADATVERIGFGISVAGTIWLWSRPLPKPPPSDRLGS
jgi:hypothetical protein